MEEALDIHTTKIMKKLCRYYCAILGRLDHPFGKLGGDLFALPVYDYFRLIFRDKTVYPYIKIPDVFQTPLFSIPRAAVGPC
jgi:hypothetical protein